MNVIDRIEKDHELQRKLMDSLVDTQGDSEERRGTFKTFCDEFKAHAAAEEQAFYAPLMEDPAGTEKARHSVAEHKTAMDLLTELQETAMDSAAWLQKFKQVKHDNEHHMEEEEKEVFPAARKLMKDNELDTMGAVFDERKAKEMA